MKKKINASNKTKIKSVHPGEILLTTINISFLAIAKSSEFHLFNDLKVVAIQNPILRNVTY